MRILLPIGVLLAFVLGGCAAKTSGAEPEVPEAPSVDEEVPPADEEPTDTSDRDVAEDPTDATEDATAGEGDTEDLDAESVCTAVDANLPLEERCAAAGAEVFTFPNTCVGKCKAMEKMMMCGQAMTAGCKCPEGQCIDDELGCCREIRR